MPYGYAVCISFLAVKMQYIWYIYMEWANPYHDGCHSKDRCCDASNASPHSLPFVLEEST
eukprot:4278-Pelagomonas_calceolata.AAC.3